MRTATRKFRYWLREKITRPVYLMEYQHPLGTMRLWTGVGKLTYQGNEWTGSGSLVQISEIEERSEPVVNRVIFQIKGVQLDADAMNMVGAPAKRIPLNVYWALVDDRQQIVPDPILKFIGFADPPSFHDDEDGMRTIELPVEGALYNLLKPIGTELSHEEQSSRFPGDTGLSRMAKTPNSKRVWVPGTYAGI